MASGGISSDPSGPLRRLPVSCGYLTVRHTAARVLTRPSFYINETLSRVNPQYVEREALESSVLGETIRGLCQT